VKDAVKLNRHRGLKIIGATTLLAGASIGILQLEAAEGTRRSIDFWISMLPFVAHYRYAQWKVR